MELEKAKKLWQSLVGMKITKAEEVGILELTDEKGIKHELLIGSTEILNLELDGIDLGD